MENPIDNLVGHIDFGRMFANRLAVALFFLSVLFLVCRKKNIVIFIATVYLLYELCCNRFMENMKIEDGGKYRYLCITSSKLLRFQESHSFNITQIAHCALPTFLYKLFFLGPTKECNEIKDMAITLFVSLSDSICIYIPKDFSIPRQCIIITNHVAYAPQGKKPNNSQDNMGHFHFLRPDQRLYIVAHGQGKSLDLLYNNYNLSKYNKEKRRNQFNKLCEKVRKHKELNEPFAVIIYAMDHREKIVSIYHHTRIFEGAIAMSMYSGAVILPVFNTQFVDKAGKTHFRQIAGNPFLPEYTSVLNEGSAFCMDDFRRKNGTALSREKERADKCFAMLARDLSKAHNHDEYDTEWNCQYFHSNEVYESESYEY